MIAVEGQVFHDPEADEALFETLRDEIDTSKVEVHEVDADVNDPAFALAMANRLHELIEADGGRRVARTRTCRAAQVLVSARERDVTREDALARLRAQIDARRARSSAPAPARGSRRSARRPAAPT